MQGLFSSNILISWWVITFRGGFNMQRINLNDFYTFGTALHVLAQMEPDKPLKEYLAQFNWARVWVDWFAKDKMIPMEICRQPAARIVIEIDRLVSPTAPADTDKILSFSDLFGIINAVRDFETIFSAEVSNKATYFVSKKGIYDTNDLIANADDLFVANVKQRIGEKAIADIREAGKCLAFDLGTASGFHIARAVETVLLDYLTYLCPKKIKGMKRSQRNLGNYIKMARDNQGDDKICAALDQFRDLHRNPLMHPEAILTVDDAFSLLGIAQSAIVAMVSKIQQQGNPATP
jgi:hypothetical protein